MSLQSAEKIVISKDDLRDAAIDERLAQQRNAGPAALQPIEERAGVRFIYAAWFYLMLAGAIGAFIGWAAMEPYFEDGVLFTGRVEQIDGEDFPPGVRHATISGVPVVLGNTYTTIRGGLKSQIGYTVDDLRVDTIVKVYAEIPEDLDILKEWTMLPVSAIRIEPPETPVTPNVSLENLRSGYQFAAALMFPAIGGMIGLMVGSIEGMICRTWRRALRSALIGFTVGLVGGFVSFVVGGVAFFTIGRVSPDPMVSIEGFVLQLFRRGLAWTIAGTTVGLGQGLALKNRNLLLNGFVGGMVGGLLGGLLFDPINLLFSDRAQMQGAELSRAIGFTVIGAAVGLMIGVTDMLTRAAWLRVTAGPLRGKEFSFTQTPIRLGSSPKNEIYLFKDQKIDPVHATIDKLRDTYEITDNGSSTGVFVNRQRVQRVRLNDGDRIQIGDSEFVYTTRGRKRED